MMERTDRHFRYLLRLISPRALLYTEMVTAAAIVRGDRERLLGFHRAEHPVALQLGGCEPEELAAAARAGTERGYDEINLNVGCPSERVKRGRFGACLMREPDLVADCVAAMREATPLDVTVKTRLGVDHDDSYGFLREFVTRVAAGGCRTFVVHARKAWLEGLSPKQNRELPPLEYERVRRLKADFPELEIVVNGGVASARAVSGLLADLDGVMVGREAYRNPYVLIDLEHAAFGSRAPNGLSRAEVVEAYIPYVQAQLERGTRLHAMTRHLVGLFQGRSGARAWRRQLSEQAVRPGAGVEVLREALAVCTGSKPA